MGATSQSLAIAQGITAARMFKQLEENQPGQREVSAEKRNVYNRALEYANKGYSNAEKAAFYRNRNRSLNSMMRQGTAAGGGQSSNALLSMGLDASTDADFQLASSEAGLRRDALKFLDKAADPFQAVQDANKSRELALYDNAVAAASNLANTSIETGVNGINEAEAIGAQIISGGAIKPDAQKADAGLTGGVAPANLTATVTSPQYAPPAPIVQNSINAPYDLRADVRQQPQEILDPNYIYPDPMENIGMKRSGGYRSYYR